MPGRPKRRAKDAAANSWGTAHVYSKRAYCPSSSTLYTIDSRTVCVDREVQSWLTTGNGRGSELTRNGTPKMASADLESAVRRHIDMERKHPKQSRFVIESKYETRSKLADDDYGQGLWLWLETSSGAGIYPRGVISVHVDHG